MTRNHTNPIRAVSNRTGVSQHIIRIWERRYKAITPKRTKTKRRYYSEQDVERLSLLKELTEARYRISQVAQLPMNELRELSRLIRKDLKKNNEQEPGMIPKGDMLESLLWSIRKLDIYALDLCLARATVEMSPLAIIEKLVIPLLRKLGEELKKGHVRTVHVQFTAASLRPFLAQSPKVYQVSEEAPLIAIATPRGQTYEFEALYALTAAAASQWRATYLGQNLPAEELAAGVHQLKAKALCLSIHYPEADPLLHADLLKLKRLLPPNFPILAGGQSADSYGKALKKIGAKTFHQLQALQGALTSLRNG